MEKRKLEDVGEFQTESRTYRFFSRDIIYVHKVGMTPKQTFRLGCIAHRENPQLIERIKVLENANDKLQKKLTYVSMQLNRKLDESVKK